MAPLVPTGCGGDEEPARTTTASEPTTQTTETQTAT
jgi:hypothetical protein